MSNELILIFSLLITYSTVLLFYRFLGKSGLYVWTAIATITANIEVIILINAFGLEQTLGNILFASTFLVTDILSENHSKKSANKAVIIGILSSLVFVIISRTWFMYTTSENDWASPAMKVVFENTPRFMIVGLLVYAVSQVLDVWLYDTIWKLSSKIFKSKEKGLWIRNNGSTLVSQFINSILFNFGAFYGMEGYDNAIIMNIAISTYLIYAITSLCDTPAVYIARKISKKNVA